MASSIIDHIQQYVACSPGKGVVSANREHVGDL